MEDEDRIGFIGFLVILVFFTGAGIVWSHISHMHDATRAVAEDAFGNTETLATGRDCQDAKRNARVQVLYLVAFNIKLRFYCAPIDESKS